MNLISLPEARRDFSHGVIASFDLVPLSCADSATGSSWSVLVMFNHHRGSEYLRAVHGDMPRQFKTLDAAISQIQQIVGTTELPRFSVNTVNGQFQK